MIEIESKILDPDGKTVSSMPIPGINYMNICAGIDKYHKEHSDQTIMKDAITKDQELLMEIRDLLNRPGFK